MIHVPIQHLEVEEVRAHCNSIQCLVFREVESAGALEWVIVGAGTVLFAAGSDFDGPAGPSSAPAPAIIVLDAGDASPDSDTPAPEIAEWDIVYLNVGDGQSLPFEVSKISTPIQQPAGPWTAMLVARPDLALFNEV